MKNNEDIKVRKVIVNVKGIDIEFDEYYRVDLKSGEEKFDRKIEIENDIRLYDIYKKKMGLLTSKEIKNIRKKFDMNQREYSLSIGVGEITVHRFENGSIQTEAIDIIMRLSSDPDNMFNFLIKNQNNLTKEEFTKFISKVCELRELEQHCIAKFNSNEFLNLKFQTLDANEVAKVLINNYNNRVDDLSLEYDIKDMCANAEYITPLKLQKLLYYIQGLSLKIYDKPAFNNNIYAWSYGPVISDVYKKYKGKNPISSIKEEIKISDGLKKIIDVVIDSYGQIETEKLIKLTHCEEPWKNTKQQSIIDINVIKNYFDKVYEFCS